MSNSESFQRVNAAALRFLSYRPRSEAEVRTRLLRRFPSNVVEEVIESLSEQNLLDDTSFSRLWTDSRVSHRPRSAAAIKRELITKGVAKDVAEDAVRDVDDQDSAYRAGLKLARRLEQADLNVFRRKMWGYLHRRGFGGSVARRTVARLWDELQENRGDGSPDDTEGR
ncbi:MAG: regulatory protein RecX [Chloroflexi bacterium]|nr:regulatory protein RecX [Chloroflexota bacterium]